MALIIMEVWKFEKMEVSYGCLRETIQRIVKSEEETIEHIIDIYKHMILFLQAWKKRLTVEDREAFEYDIDCLIEDMECACPDINEEDYDSEESNVNEYLRQFYDICDEGRCWIGI